MLWTVHQSRVVSVTFGDLNPSCKAILFDLFLRFYYFVKFVDVAYAASSVFIFRK
jgi:hypothetical protein